MMSSCLARRTLGWNYPLGDGLPLFTENPRRNIPGNPDIPGAVWWRNASLPTELMGLRACGYRLRSISCRGLAGGRGALPTSPLNSPLRLGVDRLCYLPCAAVARRRLYLYPAAGDSGLVAGPTEPELLLHSGPWLLQRVEL